MVNLKCGPLLYVWLLMLTPVYLRTRWPPQNTVCDPCVCEKQPTKMALCNNKNLTEIPDYLPADTEHLDISYNMIQEILYDQILRYRSLVKLIISGNPLFTLHPSNFKVLPKLRYLDLTGCNLTNVSAWAFNDTKLVDIVGLYMDTTPLKLFVNMNQLRSLELITNDKFVPSGLFDGLFLQQLVLKLNRARNITEKLFAQESMTMKDVIIHGPHLTALPAGLFRELINLQKVHLYVQQIESLPDTIFNITDTKSGDGCRIKEILLNGVSSLSEGIFNNLKFLKILTINDLRQPLPYNFSSYLRELNNLDLSRNNISAVQKQWFLPQNSVEYLNLSCNKLTRVNDEFVNLYSIKGLNLSYNNIHTISAEAFTKFSQEIEELDLSHNHICSFHPDLLKGMYNLAKLWLNNNCLSSMDPSLFDSIDDLQYLFLQYNTIPSLQQDSFTRLFNLIHLNISHNNISILDEDTFTDLVALQTLDMSYNFIAILPDRWISPQLMERVLFQNNPLNCGCGIKVLFDFFDNGHNKVVVEGTCASPLKFAGRRISNLTLYEICPDFGTSIKSNGNVTSQSQLISGKISTKNVQSTTVQPTATTQAAETLTDTEPGTNTAGHITSECATNSGQNLSITQRTTANVTQKLSPETKEKTFQVTTLGSIISITRPHQIRVFTRKSDKTSFIDENTSLEPTSPQLQVSTNFSAVHSQTIEGTVLMGTSNVTQVLTESEHRTHEPSSLTEIKTHLTTPQTSDSSIQQKNFESVTIFTQQPSEELENTTSHSQNNQFTLDTSQKYTLGRRQYLTFVTVLNRRTETVTQVYVTPMKSARTNEMNNTVVTQESESEASQQQTLQATTVTSQVDSQNLSNITLSKATYAIAEHTTQNSMVSELVIPTSDLLPETETTKSNVMTPGSTCEQTGVTLPTQLHETVHQQVAITLKPEQRESRPTIGQFRTPAMQKPSTTTTEFLTFQVRSGSREKGYTTVSPNTATLTGDARIEISTERQGENESVKPVATNSDERNPQSVDMASMFNRTVSNQNATSYLAHTKHSRPDPTSPTRNNIQVSFHITMDYKNMYNHYFVSTEQTFSSILTPLVTSDRLMRENYVWYMVAALLVLLVMVLICVWCICRRLDGKIYDIKSGHIYKV